MGDKPTAPPAAASFEESMKELEQIVNDMESGQMPLEEMVRNFERGTSLIQQCGKMLSDAEQKIKILEDGKLKDFKPTPQSDE